MNLFRTADESLKIGDSPSWKQRRPGTHGHGYLDDQGNVTSVTEKPTPKNEQDSQAICERLVNWLNRSAPLYGEPVPGSGEVDWLAPALHQDGENLLMQVGRAETEEEFWCRVAQAGQVRREITVAEAADLLINAVRHKKQHYSDQVRAKLVLVVDSGRSPAYTFQPVVDAFKTKYATECAESGFRSVYVVGPNSELVYRVHPCNLGS
jgi:hypothetical protein